MDLLQVLLFIPMYVKHGWTAFNSPRGRYPGGLAAKAVAVYEAFFYIWALTLGLFTPITALFAVIHFIGIPLGGTSPATLDMGKPTQFLRRRSCCISWRS